MPNYSIAVTSQFQPFTYQELVAPIAHQQQVMDALSEQYDKLSAQADVLEAMGSNDRDKNSGVYSRYKAYSDSLRKEADNLYRFGLNSESRRRLSDLRRRYNTDIVPIQNAWNKREEEAKMQIDASLKNPSLMFTRDARDTDLDEYIKNPQGGFGVINGANIAAQMGAMAKNLASQVRNGYKEGIDDYTYRYIEQHGLDANIIRDWRNNPTLSKMFEQVMQANGVTPEALVNSRNAQGILDKSTGYAEMGMWNAIGEDKSQMLEKYDTRLNAQANKELQTYAAKKAIDATYAAIEAGAVNQNRINPLTLRSPEEVSETNKKIQKFIDNGYVRKDASGKYIMTHNGWEEYRKSGDFKKFMDEANGGKAITDSKGNALPGWGPNRAGNLFAAGVKNNEEGSYDTYHTTEYDRQLSSSYGADYTKQLWSAARRAKGNTVLDAVKFEGKKGWKIDKSLTPADLEGYKATNVRYSKYGNTAILQKDGKEPVRVLLPPGINKTAEDNVRSAIANANDFGLILRRGKRPKTTANGTGLLRDNQGNIQFTNDNLTDEDRAIFTQLQRDALNEMESYGSQIVVPSETEDDKYKPFGF